MLVKILITTKEPLSVGLESIGIKTLLYKIPIVLKNGETKEIPIIPGNSFRGVLRDTMAKLFIMDVCGENSDKIEIDPGTALSMFSGGVLSRKGATKVNSVHKLIHEFARFLLPLSILGFAVSNTIIPGKIKVGCGYPVVKETKELIEDIYWKDTKIELEDIYTTVLLTRKNDMSKISKIDKIQYDEKEADNYLKSESEETGALQQRMIREAIIPNVDFVTYIREIIPLKLEEKGLLWKTLEEIDGLGGSVVRGLGSVKLSFLNSKDSENEKKAYEDFVCAERENIKEQLKKSPTDF